MVYLCVYLAIGLGYSLGGMIGFIGSDQYQKFFQQYENPYICWISLIVYPLILMVTYPLAIINTIRKKNTPDNERSDEHDS